MSYLLFDAADRAVLAECESVKDLLLMMKQFQREEPERDVRVARFHEQQGELVGIRSLTTARALTDSEKVALYRRKRA